MQHTHVVPCHDGLLTLHSAECLALNHIHATTLERTLAAAVQDGSSTVAYATPIRLGTQPSACVGLSMLTCGYKGIAHTIHKMFKIRAARELCEVALQAGRGLRKRTFFVPQRIISQTMMVMHHRLDIAISWNASDGAERLPSARTKE